MQAQLKKQENGGEEAREGGDRAGQGKGKKKWKKDKVGKFEEDGGGEEG